MRTPTAKSGLWRGLVVFDAESIEIATVVFEDIFFPNTGNPNIKIIAKNYQKPKIIEMQWQHIS